MRYSKELLKGSTSILVLSVLKSKDMYGYMLIRELEIRSENAFEMSEGTLYPILHALEKEKMLTAYWQEVDGRKRKYYHITEKGIKELNTKAEEFKDFTTAVNKVLSFA